VRHTIGPAKPEPWSKEHWRSEAFRDQTVRGRSSINATDGALHRIVHQSINRLNIEGVFLPAIASDFYRDHKLELFLNWPMNERLGSSILAQC
jgi:hypothetical protein